MAMIPYSTGPGYPGAGNTYVPPDIQGKLRIGFSRNAKKFHFPRYVQYVETPHDVAYYLKITSVDATRVINTQDFVWPDGQIDPDSDSGTESFNFIPFRTKRNSYKFRLGDIASKQASWPIIEQNAGNKASTCMTNRTIRMMTVATTPANWQMAGSDDNTANLAYDHTNTPTGLNFGYWDQGTEASPYIQQSLGYAQDIINQDTQGVVDSEESKYWLIINPRTARLMAGSPEIHAYMRSSPDAKPQVYEGAGGKYMLPPKLYGFQVLIENAVRTTSPKGQGVPVVRTYCVPNGTALVTSRVGELEGAYGAPSFTTLTMFWWQDEMTVETKHDDWNRLTRGRVVENTAEVLTCSASGYLFQSVTSV